MDQAKMIKEQTIVEENGETIFDQNAQYVIPRYQRAYAWEYDEIVQLIEDIYDATSVDSNYYIGTLIVYKTKDDPETYEVIDGQQRLTTLYLLLSYLSSKEDSDIKAPEKTLLFDCRKRSNYTLKYIEEVLKNNSVLEDERLEQSILNGLDVIRQKFEGENLNERDFYERLKKVILYRIEVPEHTDLNKYFEIMNTRGEQLEQSDILKARLMSFLDGNREEQELLAKIWDACSDMTGYVQMHFNKEYRKQIFGDSWNSFPQKDLFFSLVNSCQSESDTSERELTIKEIISPEFKLESQLENVDTSNEDVDARFESIISFPHFLLHAIRLYLPKDKRLEKVDLDKSLDDKKLISDFDLVEKSLKKEVADNAQIKKSNEADFAKGFIQHLLQLRYLFDKFIIKREFREDNIDGKWSLKELIVSRESAKAYYRNTTLKEEDQETTNNECLMIQAALRVSYTSPKVMHWITELLNWLRDNHNNPEGLTDEGEKIATEATKDFVTDRKYNLGVQTPRIVFNFLDYLLWKKDKGKYSDFQFEFHNSVEHLYPQNPSEDSSITRWDDKDVFGNLCLISRRENSRFSNLSPKLKCQYYSNIVKKGSIKLRIMGEIINESSDEEWRQGKCKEHEEEMLAVLIQGLRQK
ncbi:DUF262 domain-containing protein [uncultured Porphyromonas sp.]|uniref:DUF262 domain-containing protein n=1 Tax=uncultured Porphyromonas sp. TaxID=159274 RepID=UPI0026260BF7|nr:DUF262 domain-containing protein [uncultured Porphyromonas sp.]